jgi:acid stress-induced BolA-like protein IbaG/YrbA
MLIAKTMTPDKLKSRIEQLAPGTKAEVVDLTGTMDHYQATIVSPAFEGKMMMEQHRLVYGLFKSEIDSNEVHALTLKTYTPEQYTKNSDKR